MRARIAPRSTCRGSNGDAVVSRKSRLFILSRLDSQLLRDLSYSSSIAAQLRWAPSAIDANSAPQSSPPLLHTIVLCTPRPNSPIDHRWTPFLTPSPWHIELFIHESELEDMRLRVGSGRTAIAAVLFLPPAALDALSQWVHLHNPHFDIKKMWCLAFDTEPFDYPSSRRVPAHRPIADCWVKRLTAAEAELTLVELGTPAENDGAVLPKNTVLGTWQLHARANKS